jgi:SAM-dependent methyltransferase
MDAFDAIISTDCLEHVRDDEKLLCTIARLLAPRGALILHVPHATRNLFGFSRPNFMGIEGHVRPGYTMSELHAKVERAGLEVVSGGYNYNSWETLANDISYLITGGREKRKYVYALLFPLLLLMTRLFSWTPGKPGSAITLLASKAA